MAPVATRRIILATKTIQLDERRSVESEDDKEVEIEIEREKG